MWKEPIETTVGRPGPRGQLVKANGIIAGPWKLALTKTVIDNFCKHPKKIDRLSYFESHSQKSEARRSEIRHAI